MALVLSPTRESCQVSKSPMPAPARDSCQLSKRPWRSDSRSATTASPCALSTDLQLRLFGHGTSANFRNFGTSGANRLQGLPRSVLQNIIRCLQSQESHAPAGGPTRPPSRLLPLRLVSKGLRDLVDESLSYLRVNMRPETSSQSMGQSMVSLATLLLPGFPRWPALTHLFLSVEWGTTAGLQLALGLAVASCPGLTRLDVRDGAVAHTEVGSVDLRVLSALTRLETLGIHGFEDSFLDALGGLTSIARLEVYDVWENGVVRSSTGLRRLVLDRVEREAELYGDTEMDLSLEGSPKLESLRVCHYILPLLLLPSSLTSLTLRHVHLSGSPTSSGLLPHLVDLELSDTLLGPRPLQLHLPTSLTSLKLSRSSNAHSLPLFTHPLDSLPTLSHLRHLHLEGLDDFDHLPDLSAGSHSLTSLKLLRMRGLTCLQSLSSLGSLRDLEVRSCGVRALPSLEALGKLSKLCVEKLPVENRLDLRSLGLLRHLECRGMPGFPLLHGLQYLRCISFLPERVYPGQAPAKLVLPPLPGLERVVLQGCQALTVEGLLQGVELVQRGAQHSPSSVCGRCQRQTGAGNLSWPLEHLYSRGTPLD